MSEECECGQSGTNCARYVFEFNGEDSDEYCTKGHDINKCCDTCCNDFRDISE
jgi:hypothetical protein